MIQEIISGIPFAIAFIGWVLVGIDILTIKEIQSNTDSTKGRSRCNCNKCLSYPCIQHRRIKGHD